MKKSLILSCLLGMMSVCAMAQLEVMSNGRVKVESVLYVQSDTTTNFSEVVTSAKNGIYVNNIGSNGISSGAQNGIQINNTLANGVSSRGLVVYPVSTSTTNASEYGVLSCAGYSSMGNYALFGALRDYTSMTNGAGVFGSINAWTIPPTFTGVYAGFFNGDVRVVNGSLTAYVITPSASNGMRGDGSLGSVSELHEARVADRLQSLQLYEVTHMEDFLCEDGLLENIESTDMTDVTTRTDASITSVSHKGFSLDAAQLREVYPELVYEDRNGNIGINYVEMVPLLVQAINELKAEVESLKQNQK